MQFRCSCCDNVRILAGPAPLFTRTMNAETGLPTRPVQLPQPSIALSDPHAYWSQAKFHRFFRCPRTQRRVTFADVGDENGPVVVGFLPSLCSRYVGIVMADGLAEEVGVRLLVMDRPGSGGTERCDLNDRVSITCGSCLFIIDWNLSGSLTEIEMTESLLDHLEIRDVMLLGCSAGVMLVRFLIQ
jgi:pimeloyl-ACP methyl ester carboxylesterase